MDLAGHARRGSGGPPSVPTRISVLPGPDSPGIQVHEVGGRVVADAPAPQREADIAQLSGRDARKPHVDGAAVHVEAVLCDARGATAQVGVGGWRAVAG